MQLVSNKNFQRFLRFLPNFLWPLKIILIRLSLKSHGSNFRIGPNVILYNFREIQVGNNVFIGDRTVIEGIVPVKIGNNVMFGPEVMIRGGDHNFSIVGKPMFEIKLGGANLPIIIEDDTWIGARVIILKGVTISEGSVIGAGALVNKNTLPYSINVGVPSRPIKCRFNCNELQKHLVEVRSSYSFEHILRIYSDNNISIVNEK